VTETTTTPEPSTQEQPLPMAQTLDEATLRRVFPDAPADIEVPRDVKSIFRRRMRSFGGERHQAYVASFWGLLVAGVVLLVMGQVAAGIAVPVVAIVTAIVITVMQYSKASDDFFGIYATARGLQHQEDGHISAGVPLFSQGDKREWPRVLTGTIAGQPAKLGHYTYTEIRTDSDGNREESDFPFTVLVFTLPPQVAARFKGIYCSPKGISFGKLQDKLAHDRGVTLESLDFHKRYQLRCVDDQDDIALYELFSTTFVQQMATELKVYWEQRGDDLVFWHKYHEKEAADLDRFCLESWHVLQRYLEEWR
jgi:hypothetical protein